MTEIISHIKILYFQIYGYLKLLIVKKVYVECCLFYLIWKYITVLCNYLEMSLSLFI